MLSNLNIIKVFSSVDAGCFCGGDKGIEFETCGEQCAYKEWQSWEACLVDNDVKKTTDSKCIILNALSYYNDNSGWDGFCLGKLVQSIKLHVYRPFIDKNIPSGLMLTLFWPPENATNRLSQEIQIFF